MDYEKKYKELFEWVRGMYRNMDEADKADAERFFPELKESEDERIRKGLLRHFRNKTKPYWNEIAVKDILAWLEKQKEQEPINECNAHEPTLEEARKWNEAYEKGYSLGYENGRNEHKPAEKQDYSGLTDFERAIHRGFLCAGVENVPVTIIKETAQDCLAQMRPAKWRPYDKEVLTKIKELIDSHFSEYEQREVYKDWLDEHISQPAEWGEEEVVNLGDIKSALYDYYAEGRAEELYGWLKSLRPQSNWKPTEEQVQALWRAVEYLDESDNEDYDIIEGLYDELTKLM